MGLAPLCQGQQLIIGNKPCEMRRMVEQNVWQIEYTQTGYLETYSMDELLRMYTDETLKFDIHDQVPYLKKGHLSQAEKKYGLA